MGHHSHLNLPHHRAFHMAAMLLAPLWEENSNKRKIGLGVLTSGAGRAGEEDGLVAAQIWPSAEQ